MVVVKKDGKREHFDRNKILKGIMKGVAKTPRSEDQIETMASNIESEQVQHQAVKLPLRISGKRLCFS
jgi:transcriptional repressor NrdR